MAFTFYSVRLVVALGRAGYNSGNVKQAITSLQGRYRYSIILLKQLVLTDFKLRYQNSFLGYVWGLLRPLFMFAVLYVVFVKFFKLGADVPHFSVYLLTGLVFWNFFAEITNLGVGAIVDKGDLLRKINFPKYIVIISTAVSALINLALNFLVVIVFAIFSGVDFSWSALYLLPLLVVELFAAAIAVSLLLSAVYVRVRDVNYIWEVFMQVFFYITPVVYPFSKVSTDYPWAAKLLLLNPIAQAIQDIRHLIITPQTQTVWTYVGGIWAFVPVLFVIGLFTFAVVFFKKRAPYFAEEV